MPSLLWANIHQNEASISVFSLILCTSHFHSNYRCDKMWRPFRQTAWVRLRGRLQLICHQIFIAHSRCVKHFILCLWHVYPRKWWPKGREIPPRRCLKIWYSRLDGESSFQSWMMDFSVRKELSVIFNRNALWCKEWLRDIRELLKNEIKYNLQ